MCAGPLCSGTSRTGATSDCQHCYSQSDPHCRTEEELTTTEALGFIDDLADMGVPLILFTGGEPLIREDIWDLADYAALKGIKTALSTNGTLITADVARKIEKSGIEYAGISLDGARAETHDRFRNTPGSFNRSVAAFTHCQEAGPEKLQKPSFLRFPFSRSSKIWGHPRVMTSEPGPRGSEKCEDF